MSQTMEQFGRVVSREGWQARVVIRQHSACSQCGKCSLGHESKDLTIEAHNPINAQVGDTVVLTMGYRNVLLAGLIAYGLPLIATFLGAIIGQLLFAQDAAALVLALASLVASFLAIRFFLEPKLKTRQEYQIVIKEVVEPEPAPR